MVAPLRSRRPAPHLFLRLHPWRSLSLVGVTEENARKGKGERRTRERKGWQGLFNSLPNFLTKRSHESANNISGRSRRVCSWIGVTRKAVIVQSLTPSSSDSFKSLLRLQLDGHVNIPESACYSFQLRHFVNINYSKIVVQWQDTLLIVTITWG